LLLRAVFLPGLPAPPLGEIRHLTSSAKRNLLLTMPKLGVLFSASALLGAFALSVFAQTPAPQTPQPSATSAVSDQQSSLKLIEAEMHVPVPPTVQMNLDFAKPAGLDVMEVYFAIPGKHPLVLLTHGTPDKQVDLDRVTPWAQLKQALWFAQRGYVVFIVVRSGYGNSSGKKDIEFGPCLEGHGGFQDIANAGVDDLRYVLDFARKRPEVDLSTIVSVGVSTGGFLQTALVADPPRGLKAAISFAGGTGHDGNEHNCNLPLADDAFSAFGKGAHKHGDLPMLWVFSNNDHWYPPYMAQDFAAAYAKGGGASQLVMLPNYGTEGHDLFGYVPAWSDTVDDFLKAHNLLPLGDTLLPLP